MPHSGEGIVYSSEIVSDVFSELAAIYRKMTPANV